MSTGDVPNVGDGLIWSGSSSSWQSVRLDPTVTEAIERLEKNMEKVMERLAILEEPDPKRLEEFKTLKEAYDKYKFVDGLCGKDAK